jgi:hypothetical protein
MNNNGDKSTTYHCEVCGNEQTRDEYVAVGPTTPAAHQLGIVDRNRDHLIVCDDCFERASRDIADTEGENNG